MSNGTCFCRQGPLSEIPLDTGFMPEKILRRSRIRHIDLPLRTFESDEPTFFTMCLRLEFDAGWVGPMLPPASLQEF